MKKGQISDLIKDPKFDLDAFWAALDELPDQFDGKPLKANVRKYFNQDGTAKNKKQEGQDWKATQTYMRIIVRPLAHVNRQKKRVAAQRHIIENRLRKTHKVNDAGEVVPK
jgi:hypothetical protein